MGFDCKISSFFPILSFFPPLNFARVSIKFQVSSLYSDLSPWSTAKVSKKFNKVSAPLSQTCWTSPLYITFTFLEKKITPVNYLSLRSMRSIGSPLGRAQPITRKKMGGVMVCFPSLVSTALTPLWGASELKDWCDGRWTAADTCAPTLP